MDTRDGHETTREIRVPVAGGEIVGHLHGDHGREVMLVASVGLGERIWWRTATLLAEHARVVTFAMRGHGKSTCEIDGAPQEVLVDLPAIADHAGMSKPAVVGYEFGGAIASLSMAKHPGRFAALGVVDSPMILPTAEYMEVLDIFTVPEVQQSLVERFGLGRHGEDAASLEAFLDEQSHRIAADWMGRVPDREEARRMLVADTLVRPSGAWQRRPTVETCCALADMPEDSFAFPGRELMASLGIPIWVLNLEDGRYAEGFPEFSRFAEGRQDWSLRDLGAGLEAFQSDALAAELTSLLATLPG